MAVTSHNERHLITSEYPPQSGGVSDYTHLIAAGLAAEGETVHVWCPSFAGGEFYKDGIAVHRDLGHIAPADLYRVGRRLDAFPTPRRLLVQWVPHGYGYRSMNLPFCLWLWKRAKLKHDRVEIMVHEPFLAFREGSRKQDVGAVVHRVMVTILLRAASRIWVSIPDWETQLRPFVLGTKKPFFWLPVPSNIPVVDDPAGVARIRARYSLTDAPLVGHFGAYNRYMMDFMLELMPALQRAPDKISVLLFGKGSQELRDRIIERNPELSRLVRATGTLSAADISRHIAACDLMLQPYEDGISGRRTSVMTALSHGIPVVTTMGKATESCWAESRAVKLTKVRDIAATVEATRSLLADAPELRRMSIAAKAIYDDRFDLKRTIATLRQSTA